MVIEYYTKDIYGMPRHYAITFAGPLSSLTGRKTLLSSDLRALEAIGFELKEVLRPKQ